MLPYLFTPECWERSMHYSTTACIYQADSQLETSCTHEGGTRAGHVTTSRSRKQVRDRLARSLSLSLISILEQVDCRCLWIRPPYTGFSSPLGLRAISQQRFAALSRITGSRYFPFLEWIERVEQVTSRPSSSPPPVVAPFVFENTVPWFMEFFLLSRTRKYSRKVLNEIKIVYFLDRLKSKR